MMGCLLRSQESRMTAESMTFETEVRQRLVRLETQMEHVSTKEDLKDLSESSWRMALVLRRSPKNPNLAGSLK